MPSDTLILYASLRRASEASQGGWSDTLLTLESLAGYSGGTSVAPSSPDHLNSSSRFVRVKGPHTAIAVRCSDGGRLQARTLEFLLPRYCYRSLGDFASIE